MHGKNITHLLHFSDFVSRQKMKINRFIFTSSWEDLQGLSPPRKSALSVWRWQLMECRSLPWRLANSWQIVVLPQLQIKHNYVRLVNSWQIVILPQLKIKHNYVRLANSWQIVVLPQLKIKHKYVRLANSWQIVV